MGFEVVNHKVAPRAPRHLEWSFDMRPFGQDVLLRAGPPKGYPPDVRRAQTLQVLTPEGMPKLKPNGKLLLFTYGEVMSDLKSLREEPDPDDGLITAFSSFVAAVDDLFPLTLDELVSIYGAASIANAMGLKELTLRSRLAGRTALKLEELAMLQQRFPGFDVDSTLRMMADRKRIYQQR